MILNAHDKALLMALRRGNHFKDNPGDVTELLRASFGDVGPSEGLSSARRLYADGFVAFVQQPDPTGRALLRITDTGIALADNLIEERRPKTLRERIASFSRSDWIAIAAFVVSVIALLRRTNA